MLSWTSAALATGAMFQAGFEARGDSIFESGFESLPPLAGAGEDRNVAVGDPQVLDGGGSIDP